MNNIRACAILIIFIISNGFSRSSLTTKPRALQTTAGWETLDAENFTVQYPSTWQLDRSGQMGTSFILFSPKDSENDKFKENANLLIQDLPTQNFTLDQYAEASVEQIRTLVTNATLIESTRMRSGEEEFHKIIFLGDQGVYHLRFEQHVLIRQNKAYVLTFTCEADKFVDYSATATKLLNSFVLKR